MSNAKTNESPVATEPQKPSAMSGRLVLHAVRRHPLVFASVIASATAAAAAIWFFLPLPKVTAAVVFHIASYTPTLLAPTAADGGVPFASYKLSQASLVKSRLILNTALKQPGVSTLGVIQSAAPDPLSWLDQKVAVDSKSGSEFMRVTIEGEDADDLTILLGAVAKSYLAGVDERDNGARKQKLKKLEDSQRSYRAEVDRFQGQIDKIALALGSKDGPTLAALDSINKEDLRIAAHDLSAIRDQLLLAQRELAALDLANKPNPGEPAPPPLAIPENVIDRELQQDKVMMELEAGVTRAGQDLMKAEKDFDAGSPALERLRVKVKEAQVKRDKYRADQRSTVENRIREATRQTEQTRRDALQNKVAGFGQRAQVCEERVEGVKKAISKSNEHRIELENYKRLIEQNERLSLQMAQEVERLKVELGAPPRVTMSEEPYVVTGIEGNRRLKYTVVVGLGVFFLGFAGLVGWEFHGRRVTDPDEVTTALGIQLLGTVPPIVTNGASQTGGTPAALIEAIDITRTMLIHGTPTGNVIRTLLVTSGVAGEGKTSLSGHLAISLARAGFRTLLVDGDFHSPSAHSLFGLPPSPGLCELLRGEIDIATAARTTPIPGLSVLPAGVMDLAARQSLIGDRWLQTRKELESRFDFLVIDTAPLLIVSDTLLLAREADGVVLSVLLGVSRVSHVAETASRLRAVGAKLTGAVVNGVWHKAYQTSYRYGAAGRSQAAEPSPSDITESVGNRE
jgi:succinoglycan biosynthesis transport protein ExoP